MSAIGNRFYELLKNAPKFRYAMTGVEVDGFAFIDELTDDPEFYLKFKGFVINENLYRRINGKRKMRLAYILWGLNQKGTAPPPLLNTFKIYLMYLQI